MIKQENVAIVTLKKEKGARLKQAEPGFLIMRSKRSQDVFIMVIL